MVINHLSERFNYNQIVQSGTVYIFQHTGYNNTEYATGTRSATLPNLYGQVLPNTTLFNCNKPVLILNISLIWD